MFDKSKIKEHMPVVCSNNGQFATVDHMDGDYVKLTKDQQGQHHWIPTSWITKVDDKVHGPAGPAGDAGVVLQPAGRGRDAEQAVAPR